MLTREELLEKLTNIGTVESDIERRTLLTEITDDLNSVYEANNTLTTTNAKLEENYKKAQEANMQLFLKVGSQQKPEVHEETEVKEIPRYEDLFDENFSLK